MTDVISPYNQWSRSTMPGIPPQQPHHRKKSRRTVPRFTYDLSPQVTPRKITLYRNGDRYFNGKQMAITPQNYMNLRHLLQELSSTIDLPYGVRRLFTPHHGSEITDISVLKDGASYVCASFEPFQKLEYTAITIPRVTFNIEPLRQPLHDIHPSHRVHVRHLPTLPKIGASNGPTSTTTTTVNRYHANNLFLQSLTSATAANASIQHQQPPQPKKTNLKQNKYGVEPLHNKPRTITIVKHGSERPHKIITILLNRRTAQTFDQLLSDISEAFGYQKYRNDKIKRLFTLKGRQLNSISDFFREDEIFIASGNINDIPLGDLQEISNEILIDPHHPSPRRSQLKQMVQSPVDRNTPNAQVVTPGAIVVDVKKTVTIRDSGFLDDEEGLSGGDSELASTRVINNKPNEPVSDDAPTSNDPINRKLKKILKSTPVTNIEQQRERERQRFREEEERRKKLLIKKDHHQPPLITAVPKFEKLVIDTNNDESSLLNKSKTPTSGISKPSTIAPLPRLSITNLQGPDEGLSQKKPLIKKRSTIIHSSPAIVTDKYEFGKKMGDGNFAIVRRSKLRETDREVAIKIIDKSKMKGKDYMLDHEINIMYMCNHPNVIRLFEDYETSEEIYLVMELIKGGDLFDYITKHRRFDEATSALMIQDVSEALLYLHAKKIVHRDLKPENLLVMQRKDARITIKLTDFGLAMQVKEPIKTVCGTPTYVAPEILAETGYGVEVDCWATGIILYILLCGYPPFKAPDRNQEELFQMIQRGKFTYDAEYWSSISPAAKNLIEHLLVVDRHKRIRADEILLHPWIMTVGQSKPIHNTEELKTTLRTKYAAKIKEYAMENIAP